MDRRQDEVQLNLKHAYSLSFRFAGALSSLNNSRYGNRRVNETAVATRNR